MSRQWKAMFGNVVLLTVLGGLGSLPTSGQEPPPPPAGVPDPAETQPVPGVAESLPEREEPEPQRFPHPFQLVYTWLPGDGTRGFQVNDAEISATFALPLGEKNSPLLFTPAFVEHSWAGPNTAVYPGRPDLPAQAYDAALDVAWRPRLAPWLFADLALTPGVYADYHAFTSESFRLHGRAVGIVAFSPQFQLAAGILYVSRLHVQLLPAGGIIWSPDKDTKCELLFPQPKVSRRLTTLGETQWWGYLMGEFGGGTWTIRRASGADDLADYSDLRLLAGLEWVCSDGLKGRFEAGYVFNRQIRYTSATPGLKADNTLLARFGLAY